MKMSDMKLMDQLVGHELAERESDRCENDRHIVSSVTVHSFSVLN